MRKFSAFIQFVFILLFSISSLGKEAVSDKKDFFIKLSIDNNITSSQNASTNVAFSAISSLAYLSNEFQLNENLLYRAGLGYLAAMTVVLDHELSGHGFRALELNGRIMGLKMGLSPYSGALHHSSPVPPHVQKDAIISLGGIQADYLLSQKISDNLVLHNQKIDPITAVGYIFSAGMQIGYNYTTDSDKSGHDLLSYTNDMETMYGDKSMSLDIIKYYGFLSFLDPMLFASMYSATTGKNIDIPSLHIKNIGIVPFARAIITPYGAIEKKFGAYIFTDYTPIKIGFSFGKQFKTNTPKDNIISTDLQEIGRFTDLQADEAIEKHNTYSFDISVFKLLDIYSLNVGVSTVFWRQPELFVQDPYREKPKNGFMFTINSSYEASENINILCDIGYKSKGFVPGQYLDKTFIVNLALEYKM